MYYITRFSPEAILFQGYSSGTKHAFRKTAYLPNRTCVASSVTYYMKAYIHPNIFGQVSDQFDAFFNPKNASENNAKRYLRHILVNLKKVRVLAPPMSFSIELRRQCQPVIFQPIDASDGALRVVSTSAAA